MDGESDEIQSNLDEMLWQSRILQEKAQEKEEWKIMTEVQLDSQISRIKMTLHRQILTNEQLKIHLSELEKQINNLTAMAEEIASEFN